MLLSVMSYKSFCGGRDTMRRRSILVHETLRGRVVLALAAMAALMAIQSILGASPALAISERPGATAMTNGEVYASALSKDGHTLYIGGNFTEVMGTSGVGHTVSNLAAIDVDSGAMIRTWRPRVTGNGAVVRSLAVKDGRVYFGGNFTAVEGQPRKNLAAVGANTASVDLLPFAPQVGGDTSYVYALAVDDSRLYAGGGFSKVNGYPRKNLAAFTLATGALSPVWKPATTVAPSCKAKCSSKVRALKLGPMKTIFVGGAFSYISGSNGVGANRQSVARLYTATGNLHPWKIPDGTIGAQQTAWDLTWAGDKLYVGFGAILNYVAAFNIKPNGKGAQIWRFNTRGNVQTVALTPNHSRLFFGGHFGINDYDKKVCHKSKFLRGLASLNPQTGKVYCDFVPSLDQRKRPSYRGAWTLTTSLSYLWVGGGFIGVSDSVNQEPSSGTGTTEVPQTNLARFRL
jgi:hypothetical protein